MAPTPSQRLINKLRDMGHTIPEDAEIERTYAGRREKANGANSWFLPVFHNDGTLNSHIFGSQWPVTELLKRGFTAHPNNDDYNLVPNQKPKD